MPGAVRREATVDGREEDDMGEGGAGPVRREKAFLDMEERWWAHGRRKADAIATLGMSQTRYYLALNRILMDPRSRMERPELVGRLIRLRERRIGERGGK